MLSLLSVIVAVSLPLSAGSLDTCPFSESNGMFTAEVNIGGCSSQIFVRSCEFKSITAGPENHGTVIHIVSIDALTITGSTFSTISGGGYAISVQTNAKQVQIDSTTFTKFTSMGVLQCPGTGTGDQLWLQDVSLSEFDVRSGRRIFDSRFTFQYGDEVKVSNSELDGFYKLPALTDDTTPIFYRLRFDGVVASNGIFSWASHDTNAYVVVDSSHFKNTQQLYSSFCILFFEGCTFEQGTGSISKTGLIPNAQISVVACTFTGLDLGIDCCIECDAYLSINVHRLQSRIQCSNARRRCRELPVFIVLKRRYSTRLGRWDPEGEGMRLFRVGRESSRY
jgi:hypothetical protein